MSKNSDVKKKSNMLLLYIFAFIAHLLMACFFLRYNVTIMIYFNIFSLTLYMVLIAVSRSRESYTVISIGAIISLVEVIAHQLLAILCVGTDIGFQYFLIMVAVIIMLQPKEILGKKFKISSCIAVIILMVAVSLHASVYKPYYTLPANVVHVMLIFVTVVSVFGILVFSYNQWALSEGYSNRIEELLGERTVKINQMQEKIIHNFADIVETRDGSTGGHIKRTSAYVEAIADCLRECEKYRGILTDDYVQMVISAAPLHDIGKISISDSILCKKGKLTEEEYDIMKSHSAIGSDMLNNLLGDIESDEYVCLAMDIARYHHEKWNGKGYPEGLSGEDIPLCARIMAVADVFDALTSVRVYKNKFTLDEAYQIMEDEAGKQFDPLIIKEFTKIRPKINDIYTSLSD